MIWTEKEFARDGRELASALVGRLLCRRIGDEVRRVRILETECYFGEEDTACHAHRGRTARTEIMYAPGGRAYVYLCYGLHHLLNLTTGPEGHPEAVLIRGVEGAIGPGRVTRLLSVDRSLNGCPLTPESGLWVEDDGEAPTVISAPRVGIGYASAEDQARPWRYMAIEMKKERK